MKKASILLGNVLEHYDSALFGLLAPKIALIFFSREDPLNALLHTYGLLAVGVLARPFGALFFGWIGDLFSATKALRLSMYTMGFFTFMMGCLPSYEEAGFVAPLLLLVCRFFQGFSMGGEAGGAALVLFEGKTEKQRGWLSSLYGISTMAGIWMASLAILWIDHYRILFWLGALIAFVAMQIRSVQSFSKKTTEKKDPFSWKGFLPIFFVSGFSYVTYSIPFVLMNGYMPLVCDVSFEAMAKMGTALMFFDILLIPIAGFLTSRFGFYKVMGSSLFFLLIGSGPLFFLHHVCGVAGIWIFRAYIVFFGVCFSVPYYQWARGVAAPHSTYRMMGFAGSLGAECLGKTTPMIVLALYKWSGWEGAICLYIALAAGGALLAFYTAALFPSDSAFSPTLAGSALPLNGLK